jgi:hypothetical protein
MKPTKTMLGRLRTSSVASRSRKSEPRERGGEPPPWVRPGGDRPGDDRPDRGRPRPDPQARRRMIELMRELERTENPEDRLLLLRELQRERAAERPEPERPDQPPRPARPGRSAEVAGAIADTALTSHPPGTPGTVAVRLIGLDDADERVPLGGVRVRMTSGEHSTEAVTDALGHVIMAAPGEDAFDIEVLAPDGSVVAAAKSRLPGGQPATIPLTIHATPALADSLARGRAWRADIDRRAARVAEPGRPGRVEAQPMEARMARLEASVARLEQLVTRLAERLPTGETPPNDDQGSPDGSAPPDPEPGPNP